MAGLDAGETQAGSRPYAWLTLHPIDPITLQKYREEFVISRAKDDTKDAEHLADLLLNHQTKLPVWPQSPCRRR